MGIVKIWRNLEQKRNIDCDFPPHYMWEENNNIGAVKHEKTEQRLNF